MNMTSTLSIYLDCNLFQSFVLEKFQLKCQWAGWRLLQKFSIRDFSIFIYSGWRLSAIENFQLEVCQYLCIRSAMVKHEINEDCGGNNGKRCRANIFSNCRPKYFG